MPLQEGLCDAFDQRPTLDFSVDSPKVKAASSPPPCELDYFDLEFDRNDDKIDEGGNAVVYRATVPELTDPVAIKQPFPKRSISKKTARQILEEAKRWAKVDSHPYIASVVDWGYDGPPWVAIEYMDGGPLTDKIGRLSLEQRLWTAYAIIDAVAHATGKRGLAHHDIKPNNILFRETPDGVWDVPKVADWGLSRELIERTESISQATPDYAAPEQHDKIMPDAPVDVQTDVYQLGVVCYELLTAHHPNHLRQSVQPPSTVDEDLPSQLDDVLLTAIAHDRDQRYDHPLLLRHAFRQGITEWDSESQANQSQTTADQNPHGSAVDPSSDSNSRNSETIEPSERIMLSETTATSEANGISAPSAEPDSGESPKGEIPGHNQIRKDDIQITADREESPTRSKGKRDKGQKIDNFLSSEQNNDLEWFTPDNTSGHQSLAESLRSKELDCGDLQLVEAIENIRQAPLSESIRKVSDNEPL